MKEQRKTGKTAKRRLPLPLWSIVPLFYIVVCDVSVYFGTRVLTLFDVTFHNVEIPAIDGAIPFVPAFIVVYVLAYLQWGLSFVIIAQSGREVCYHYTAADCLALLVCGVCFVVYPTMMFQRPEATGSGFIPWLTRLVFEADTPPINLFPSIHCLESWLCFRSSIDVCRRKGTGKWYPAVQGVFTVLVFLSTVFLHQHVMVDLVAGLALAELALFVTRGARTYRVIDRLNPKIFNK